MARRNQHKQPIQPKEENTGPQTFFNGDRTYSPLQNNSSFFSGKPPAIQRTPADENENVGNTPMMTSSPGSCVADTIPETGNQFYGHGAFMGAAPQLMADRKWNRILQVLMPDVHADVTNALSGGPNSPAIILMMENNPVMGAYGMWQTHQMDVRGDNGRSNRIAQMQAIEWDVFLPDETVAAFKRATTDDEKRRLAHEMVENMIIAHGNTSQTVFENFFDERQYGSVRETRKSGQGGVRPGAWMDLFGRALRLARDPNWQERAKEYEDPTLHPREDTPEDQAKHLTFKNPLDFSTVINEYKTLFGKETFSVLLDIKSRDATPDVLRAFVTDLNLRGVHVYGVGSFQHQEIAGLGGMTQTVDGQTYSGPREVKFYHWAGNLQNDCLANNVRAGDTVMFNAGSLIDYDSFKRGPEKKASYRIKTEVVNQLKTYKDHYGFQLGIYVQEDDIDDHAATLINDLANTRPDIFDLGFAWGGLSGQAARDIEPSLAGPTIGLGKQGRIAGGRSWDTSRPQPGGFNSTISMRYRFLQSRSFHVDRGSVTVNCDAAWSDPYCSPGTYHMTLVQEISWWPDSEKGTRDFTAGRSSTADWAGLETGTYYLQIWMGDHNPNCELSGNIQVST